MMGQDLIGDGIASNGIPDGRILFVVSCTRLCHEIDVNPGEYCIVKATALHHEDEIGSVERRILKQSGLYNALVRVENNLGLRVIPAVFKEFIAHVFVIDLFFPGLFLLNHLFRNLNRRLFNFGGLVTSRFAGTGRHNQGIKKKYACSNPHMLERK